MNASQLALRRACTVRPPPVCRSIDALCLDTSTLRISTCRSFHSARRNAATESRKTPEVKPLGDLAERSRRTLDAQQEEELHLRQQRGSLAKTSLLAVENMLEYEDTPSRPVERALKPEDLYTSRAPSNMELALNPRPNARARWQRKMVIRDIKRGGRIDRETLIARTERSHTSASHFFKTSMKKLAPLARQIAGKPIDEAILQMRFSDKKVAQEVRKHLIQARNEAIVMKGMASYRQQQRVELGELPVIEDPAEGPRSNVGQTPHETDIYIAQAWINRGRYGRELEFRARGLVNTLRPPYTGITVLLKEEKTRARESEDKEARALQKRMSKNKWGHLPDRKVTAQRTHLLW